MTDGLSPLDPMWLAALSAGLRLPSLADGPSVREAPSAANVTAPATTNAGAAAQGGFDIRSVLPAAAQAAGLFGNSKDAPLINALRPRFPGAISEAGAAPGMFAGNDKPPTLAANQGDGINVTAQARYGERPFIYGGGSMAMPGDGMPPAQAPAGMFAGDTQHKHKGLFPGKDWKVLAGILANTLAAWSAANGNPAGQAILENNLAMQRLRSEQDYKRRQPQQVGDSLIQLNPQTGGYDELYRDPQPFEAYAKARNLVPGTPEYGDAVEQYRLGAWSDPAVEAKTDLAGYRYDRQEGLIDHRFDRSDQQLDRRLTTQRDIASGHDATSRSNTRYRVDHPASRGGRSGSAWKPPTPSTVIGGIMDKQARGEPLTPAEQNTLKEYRTHYKPQRGAVQVSPNEATASLNGRKIVVRGGSWVYADDGTPAR